MSNDDDNAPVNRWLEHVKAPRTVRVQHVPGPSPEPVRYIRVQHVPGPSPEPVRYIKVRYIKVPDGDTQRR
jgi:hypothetical protein